MNSKHLLLAAVLGAGAAQAATVTLDFDGAVNTDITSAYAGLSFNAPVAGTGPVRTWGSPSAQSGNNVLGLSGQNNFYAFNQSTGAIDIVFGTAVSFVSIEAAFIVATDQFLGIGGTPFMAVYSSDVISSANRIGLEEWNIAGDACLGNNFCTSGWDNLAFSSATANIKAIRLSGFLASTGGVSRLAMFDTLSYGSVDGGGGSVPEPTSLALCLAALAGAGAARRGRGGRRGSGG
ncbi:MAG: PEP-CTERM sorting domain-containing protein [Rubrivivax sp.]|nr:PEP-CTERM sorting domain-containing protein [Rubrivivax sp.]